MEPYMFSPEILRKLFRKLLKSIFGEKHRMSTESRFLFKCNVKIYDLGIILMTVQ